VRAEDAEGWEGWNGGCHVLDLTTEDARRNLQLELAEAASDYTNMAGANSTQAMVSFEYLGSGYNNPSSSGGIQTLASSEESAFLPSDVERNQGMASIPHGDSGWSTIPEESSAAGQWNCVGLAPADVNPSEVSGTEPRAGAREEVGYGTAVPADMSAAAGSWNTWAGVQASSNDEAAVSGHVNSMSFMNLMSEFGCVPTPASESLDEVGGGDAHLEDDRRRSAALSALEAFNDHASMDMTPLGFAEDSQSCSLADAIGFSLAF